MDTHLRDMGERGLVVVVVVVVVGGGGGVGVGVGTSINSQTLVENGILVIMADGRASCNVVVVVVIVLVRDDT